MAINTSDFGNYVTQAINNSHKYKKWWDKIIPKIEEGRVIPNGISYKYSNKKYHLHLYIMLRVYNFKVGLMFYKYKDYDEYVSIKGEKINYSYDFKIVCSYK